MSDISYATESGHSYGLTNDGIATLEGDPIHTPDFKYFSFGGITDIANITTSIWHLGIEYHKRSTGYPVALYHKFRNDDLDAKVDLEWDDVKNHIDGKNCLLFVSHSGEQAIATSPVKEVKS